MIRLERRRDGTVFVLEEYGPDADELRNATVRWPGSYVQWEATGIPLPTTDGSRSRSSGPTWALWRPRDTAPLVPELEDPADFLSHHERLRAPNALTHPPATVDSRDDESHPASNSSRHYIPPRLQPRTTKYKNLTRIETSPKHRPGYLVRVTWAKKTYTKYFADAAYGDRLGSLAAAVEWRDQTEREVGKPHTSRPVIGVAYSNTGIVGISRTTKAGKPIFQVTWYEEGKQRRRVFSIELMGEQKALRAARKVRAEVERQK